MSSCAPPDVTAHCDGELADPIRAFLADISELSAATRKQTRRLDEIVSGGLLQARGTRA